MSRKPKGFWRALDRLAGGAVMAEWTRELGDELERAQPLLRLLPDLAATHPCMNVLGCGEPHWVEEIETGRWAAVGGSEHSCPPFRLERKDLFLFGLDTGRLCSRIAGALGLGGVNGRKVGQARAEVVGTYGAAASPVYLMLPGDSARMMREVERLFGAQPDPFVLLTPTGVHCSPEVETMLRRQCCMHIALSSAVVLGPGGTLAATAAVEPLLAEFERRLADRPKVATGLKPGDATKAQTEELKAELWKVAEAIKHAAAAPPPINQGEAERIFAVLQRLRSKRAGMLAPLYDVFVATVLEGRSQRAAAKSCHCSPALLSKRVGELEQEFRLPLKQLQNYTQPLLEMETSVKGQRYARKNRGAPPDETGQYEDDDSQTTGEDDDGYLREERQDDS